ncbi:MAG TPA: hypothetical protein PLX69_08920 [Leptospiraceae bacterium]|nr:hypothetical protein [Leptospiraceae bacterium]HRG74666.1 hypothetical protein [Leptospiraceae bacterium]
MIRFLFIILGFTLALHSSPVHFIFEDAGDLKKRVGACSEWDKKKGFQFKERHFEKQEFEKISQEISQAARTSGKERVSQLKCILNLKLSDSDKDTLAKSLDLYKENFLSLLEYYNRWIFSLDKTNLMTPMDKKYTSELMKLKFDLYNLLHDKTKDMLFSKGALDKEELDAFEEQITSIYLSILKGNYEYYNLITPELRKEIFKRITD